MIVVLPGVVTAAPPVFVGFLTGADSAVTLYWFHPELHTYEVGLDQDTNSLPFMVSEEPGDYAVAQRWELPCLSFVDRQRVKVSPSDYDNLPGDRYSQFTYLAWWSDPDSLPPAASVVSGTNSLCQGIPCPEEWVDNPLHIADPVGEPIWLGFGWADTTPAAPQIVVASYPQAERFNLLRQRSHDGYTWSQLPYAFVFRCQFMTTVAVDYPSTVGWRRDIFTGPGPDGFRITAFTTSNGGMPLQFDSGNDTLMQTLPVSAVDSVTVRSLYGGQAEDSIYVAVFDSTRVLPLSAEIYYTGYDSTQCAIDLAIQYDGGEAMDLAIGYDGKLAAGGPRRQRLEPGSFTSLPFSFDVAGVDTTRFLIILQDSQHRYYPYLAVVSYPPQETTDADRMPDDAPRTSLNFQAFPNPSSGVVTFQAVGTGALSRGMAIELFNILGQKVWEGRTDGGEAVVWSGCDLHGRPQPSGVYLARLIKRGQMVWTEKIILKR